MALNEIYANGDSLNYAVNSAVNSGDLVVLGSVALLLLQLALLV